MLVKSCDKKINLWFFIISLELVIQSNFSDKLTNDAIIYLPFSEFRRKTKKYEFYRWKPILLD